MINGETADKQSKRENSRETTYRNDQNYQKQTKLHISE